MIDGSSSAYSITSNASSIQPSAGGDESTARVGRSRPPPTEEARISAGIDCY